MIDHRNKFKFMDIENTLSAIMVERVSCVYVYYPSMSIFSPDLSSTVKWSSQIMMRSSHRFTRDSSKASRCAGCCLMKSCIEAMVVGIVIGSFPRMIRYFGEPVLVGMKGLLSKI